MNPIWKSTFASMTRRCGQTARWLAAVAVYSSLVPTTRADWVDIVFPADGQTMTASLDINAYATAQGSGYIPTSKAGLNNIIGGPFILSPSPQTVAVTSLGGVPQTGTYHPTVAGATLNIDANQITDMQNLAFSANPGFTVATNDAAFTTQGTLPAADLPPGGVQILPAIVNPITASLHGTLSSLSFTQTGDAQFSATGPGTGTFTLSGLLTGQISNTSVLIDRDVLGISIPFYTTHLYLPASASGTYTLSGPPGHTKISLDGNAFGDFTSSIVGPVAENNSPLGTINATVGLFATLPVSVEFHLDPTIAVPEPGSVMLLGIGMLGLVQVARRRLQRSGK